MRNRTTAPALIERAVAPAIIAVGLRVILPTLAPLPAVNLTGRTQSIQRIVVIEILRIQVNIGIISGNKVLR